MLMLITILQENMSKNFTILMYISKTSVYFLIREMPYYYLILSKLFLPHIIFIKYSFLVVIF